MRFLVDECAGPALARWLSSEGHNVFSVFEEARGISDETVIKRACNEDRILITTDKDFGELIFREQKIHNGVILLRLGDEQSVNKISVLKRLLSHYKGRLVNSWLIISLL